MQYKGITVDRKKVKYYFVYNGQKLGQGTQVRFNYDFYKRNLHGNFFAGFSAFMPKPSIFYCVFDKDGKNEWHFNNCIVEDIDVERDIKEITLSKPYIVKTDKDRIREKKKKGETWEYIWPGTLVYIFCMIFITVFNERVWGWIAATILYNNYCYEQLSK